MRFLDNNGKIDMKRLIRQTQILNFMRSDFIILKILDFM